MRVSNPQANPAPQKVKFFFMKKVASSPRPSGQRSGLKNVRNLRESRANASNETIVESREDKKDVQREKPVRREKEGLREDPSQDPNFIRKIAKGKHEREKSADKSVFRELSNLTVVSAGQDEANQDPMKASGLSVLNVVNRIVSKRIGPSRGNLSRVSALNRGLQTALFAVQSPFLRLRSISRVAFRSRVNRRSSARKRWLRNSVSAWSFRSTTSRSHCVN
jgi:hypothetical protein